MSRPHVAQRKAKCPRTRCEDVTCVFFHNGQVFGRYALSLSGNRYIAVACGHADICSSKYCTKAHVDSHIVPEFCYDIKCIDINCRYAHFKSNDTDASGCMQVDVFPNSTDHIETKKRKAPDNEIPSLKAVKRILNDAAHQVPVSPDYRDLRLCIQELIAKTTEFI